MNVLIGLVIFLMVWNIFLMCKIEGLRKAISALITFLEVTEMEIKCLNDQFKLHEKALERKIQTQAG